MARPGGHRSPNYLVKTMRESGVTCAHFVPSMLRMFLRAKGLEELSLRLVFCSGEALPYDLRSDFLQRVKSELHNLYGPTEAAVDVSAWDCRDEAGGGIVPIGKPISNIQLFVLGEAMRPLAAGHHGRAVHRRHRPGAGLPQSAGSDGAKLHPQSGARRRWKHASTAPAIWRASCPTGTSISSAASIIR